MADTYFSHDSRAQDDEKIIALRMDHGWAGYGLYWAIVERLRDADDYSMKANFKAIAFALMTDEELVRSIIEEYGLFIVEDGRFYSESLLRRMEKMGDKSQKAREAAEARWAKKKQEDAESEKIETVEISSEMQVLDASNADAMQTHSERNADHMQLNEIKLNEIKYIKPTTPRGRAREGPVLDDEKPRSADDPELIDFFKSLEGTPEMATSFYNHYASQGWLKPTGLPIASWRAMAHKWINDEKFNPSKRNKASPRSNGAKTQTETKYKNPNHEW